MKIKRLLSVLIIISFSTAVYSQYLENDPKPSQRIFWGGNLGLSFGTVTYIELNPIVGYRLTNRLSAGLGANYTYMSSKHYDYKGSIYGGSIFASFAVIKSISNIIPINFDAGVLLYGENILLNMQNYYHGENVKWVNTPLLGAALQLPIGNRSFAMIMVLFNFNESIYSMYPNPVIRVSFNF